MRDKPQSGIKRKLSPTDSLQRPEIFITVINILKNNLEGCDIFAERINILETS